MICNRFDKTILNHQIMQRSIHNLLTLTVIQMIHKKMDFLFFLLVFEFCFLDSLDATNAICFVK